LRSATLVPQGAPPFADRLRGPAPAAACCDHRSIASMIEVMIRDHCSRNGIMIQEQPPLALEDDTETKSPDR
jgi:hypothetical protein